MVQLAHFQSPNQQLCFSLELALLVWLESLEEKEVNKLFDN